MDNRRWQVLYLIGIAVVLTLSTWFSATAVAWEISTSLGLTPAETTWLTNAVQLGFVTGALVSSFFAVADIWPMTRVLVLGAVCAGISNAILLLEPGAAGAVLSRFLTGVSLALVYPTAMKFIGSWFKTGRGLAMGAVVGALTLGSASPHLIRATGTGLDWKFVITATSVACFVAAVIFALLKEGPHKFKSARFKLGLLSAALRNRAAMLANVGYFGHMWELYALWGWLLTYVTAAQSDGLGVENASLVTFAAIAVGVLGCITGGWFADRIGRCLTSSIAMVISGFCAVLIGFVYDGPSTLFLIVALIWGFFVIADSAQFSAAVSEVSDPTLVGASLAFQMGIGFAITIFAVWLIPEIAASADSWRWAFLVLAIGPVIGVWAMMTLRQHPDAIKIANGKR